MQNAIDQKIEEFFSTYPTRHFNKRHILIYTDDPVTYVYYLRKGRVKQYGISDAGEELVLNVFKEHAFFPMSHAINHTQAKYLFEAEEDIVVNQAPAKDVLKFVRSNPDVLYDLMRRVYRGTEGIIGRMEQLMGGSAERRLCYELILEAQRFGDMSKDDSYTINMSEKTLGARSGLTRETVNREVHKLKEKGLIRVERNKIVIPDLDALRETIS